MLFAVVCPVCGAQGAAPCADCEAALWPAAPGRVPPLLDGLVAVLSYEGVGRELVARLKYRNARAPMRRLAASMAALVDPAVVDVVTWAPTTGARRRRRGFDQAELLARSVANALGRPCRALLVRQAGPAQTGRPGIERRHGPVFAARSGPPPPAHVLLVDDVVTTGATLTAAARALRAAGAVEVRAVTAARTPLKARGSSTEIADDGHKGPLPAAGVRSTRP